MRLVLVAALLLTLQGCFFYPKTSHPDPRYPTQTGRVERIDPYHRDKVPDTPYEIRKAEQERDDHLAGNTGPKYPPLFKDQKNDKDGGS